MGKSPLFADLSSNNQEFVAHQYRAAGHIVVAIKATEGLLYVNPDHMAWSHAAIEQRIAVVHYHFARPDLGDTPEAEAARFLEVALPVCSGRDYLALDLERGTPEGWSHDPQWSQRFDKHVQDHSRFHTILYAARSTLASADNWLVGEHRRVWDADWSADEDYAPEGYHVFARQQSGVTAGVPPYELPGVGACDVDVARGVFWEAILANSR